MNYVFYKGQLHEEYEPPRLTLLPQFSFIYNSQQGRWYYAESVRYSVNIEAKDVPTEYRTQLLLINPH